MIAAHFQSHILTMQEQAIGKGQKSSKQDRRLTWMSRHLLLELRWKPSVWISEAKPGDTEGLQSYKKCSFDTDLCLILRPFCYSRPTIKNKTCQNHQTKG